MKNTFFFRLFLANGIAAFLTFSAIFAAEQFSIKRDAETLVRSSAVEYAANVSGRATSTLESLTSLTNYFAASLSTIDPDDALARERAVAALTSLLATEKFVYNAWFAFEPNAFDGRDAEFISDSYPTGRFMRSFLNSDGKPTEVFDMLESDMDDPALSPWYAIPLSTGKIYANGSNYYDYNDGNGPQFVAEIVWPVFHGGKAIGCAGVDILYTRMYSFFEDLQGLDKEFVILFSGDGTVVYSPDRSLISKNLSHFGFSRTEDMMRAINTGEAFISEEISPITREYSIIQLYPAQIGGEHWATYVEAPYTKVAETFKTRQRTMLAISVIGLLAFEIILFIISQTMSRPIKKMTETINEISNGNYEQAVEYEGNSGDEIGVFAGAINRMITQLQQNAANLENEVMNRTSDMMRMKKKAEDAAAVKIQFLANMSHEIRTPMNVIIGMSELLLVEPLNSRQRHLVSDIKTSATSLLDIVNDILDISRIEADKLRLSPVDYDFPVMIENITSLVFFSVRSKGVYFFSELPSDMPRCLYGDPVRMRQVLVNVLGNAVKFTSDGYVRFAVAVTEDELIFTVEDTGIGIRENEGINLFDVFEQAQSSSTRNIQGAGLGLSITKSLLDMMGGTISFESTYGKGTTFIITVPKVLGDPSNIHPDEPDFVFITAQNAHILVVDDNEVNLNVASGFLKMCGIECDTALTARTALEMISAKEYDLIFMDHMMPEMDGVEAAAKIRQMGGRFAEIPVVALTANAVEGAKELFLQAGMNDLLPKPIDKAELNIMLKKWLPADKIAQGGTMARLKPPVYDGDELPGSLAWTKDVPGLDAGYALGRIGGMEDVYERGLKITARKIPSTAERILAFMQERNMKAYMVEVHGVKGSLAEIGALDLSSEARALELAANKGDEKFCLEQTDAFLAKLTELGAALTAGFNETEQPCWPTEPGDAETLYATLREIHTALDDFAGEEALLMINGLMLYTYGEETDRLLGEMLAATEEYDYLEGMKLAERILGDMQ